MRNGLFQRLSYRQARTTVCAAVGLSLAVTALQFLYDVHRERAAIADTTRQVTSVMNRTAAKALYDLDVALATEVLDGLSSYAPVFESELRDESGLPLATFARPLQPSSLRWLSKALFGGSVEVTHALTFEAYGEAAPQVPVGTLSVTVDSHRIAEAFLSRAGTSVLSGLASNLLLGLLLGIVFQRTITAPILTVARGLAAVRPDEPGRGRLEVPPRHEGSELGFLVRRTNDLLDRYRRVQEEQERVMHDLAAARERAEAASRAKSQFLATISHELRTPLNAIIGFSQILREDVPREGPQAAHADFADEIHASGHHLLGIINDVLDLANLETGRAEPQPEPVEVRPLFESCARAFAAKLAEAGTSLTLEPDPAAAVLFADPRAVRQMLNHLLSNAAKFTPAGGSITLAALPADDGVALVVRDTGIGIDPKDLPRVFQPFWQAAPVLSRRYQGTGLGLTMVKTLVDLHHGRVTVDSAPGRGTTVTVVLPHQRGVTPPSTCEPVAA